MWTEDRFSRESFAERQEASRRIHSGWWCGYDDEDEYEYEDEEANEYEDEVFVGETEEYRRTMAPYILSGYEIMREQGLYVNPEWVKKWEAYV